jgi:hypothetical protein
MQVTERRMGFRYLRALTERLDALMRYLSSFGHVGCQ